MGTSLNLRIFSGDSDHHCRCLFIPSLTNAKNSSLSIEEGDKGDKEMPKESFKSQKDLAIYVDNAETANLAMAWGIDNGS